MCEEHNDRKCCCCYGPQGPQGVPGMQGPQGVQGSSGQDGRPGPIGPQGSQGPSGQDGQPGSQGAQGTQGMQGVSGQDGQNGQPGPQGPMGSTGPQGPQGLQGIPGKDCEPLKDCCCLRFCNVYSSLTQTVGAYSSANDAVLFDKQNAVSPGDFDLSMANINGDIKFLKHGIYQLQWKLQARIQPPIPDPVPSWSFGFWLNGVLVLGSIYSGWTQSPQDAVTHDNGVVMIEVNAGDILKLRNTCISIVDLNPNVLGSVFPITIASVNINCLQALP